MPFILHSEQFKNKSSPVTIILVDEIPHLFLYSGSTKVLTTTTINLRIAIVINRVSRYSKVGMLYAMRPLTAPPSSKQWT